MTASVVHGDTRARPPGSDARDGTIDALFVAQYRRLVAIAFRIVGDRADAEDIAQETFAQFMRAGRISAERAGGWLAVTATHRALNLVRSRKRRITRELSAFRLAHPLNGGSAEHGNPLASIERAEVQLLVRAAMLRLPARSAQVLAMRYAGATYNEIAGTLGVGVAQVGTRLVRAERALRKEIEHAARR